MKLSDISLIEERKIGNDFVLRIENDDWGKFIRVVDKNRNTVWSKLIINQDELEFEIQRAIKYIS